jgi:hypothetical protein
MMMIKRMMMITMDDDFTLRRLMRQFNAARLQSVDGGDKAAIA